MIEANAVHSTARTDSSPFRRLSSEQELDPRDVLTELFREALIPNPDLMAELVIAQLGPKGFIVWPTERRQEPRKPQGDPYTSDRPSFWRLAIVAIWPVTDPEWSQPAPAKCVTISSP